MKEEITAKDHALVKEHFDHAKVEKEKEGLRNELSKMKKLLEDNAETIDSQNQELIKLTSMIQKMDGKSTFKKNKNGTTKANGALYYVVKIIYSFSLFQLSPIRHRLLFSFYSNNIPNMTFFLTLSYIFFVLFYLL